MWKVLCLAACTVLGFAFLFEPVQVHPEPGNRARVRARIAGWEFYDEQMSAAEAERQVRWLGLAMMGAGMASGIGAGLLLCAITSFSLRRGWIPKWLLPPEWVPAVIFGAAIAFFLANLGGSHGTTHPDGTETVDFNRYGIQVYKTTGPAGSIEFMRKIFFYGVGGGAALIGGLIGFLLWRRSEASNRSQSC